MKTKRKLSPLKVSPFFSPKLGKDQKKRSSLKISSIFGRKSHENQKKRVSTQIMFICVLKLSAQVTKGGEHAAILC